MEEDVGSVNMTMYVLPSLRMGHVLVCMYLPKTLYLMRVKVLTQAEAQLQTSHDRETV